MPGVTYDLPSLRRLRLARGFVSAAALAARVGVSKQTIQNIESGTHLPMESTLRQIARVLLGAQSGWKTAPAHVVQQRLIHAAARVEEYAHA